MAKISREEWLSSLKVGDKISVTFPGDRSPSVGTVAEVAGGVVDATFPTENRRALFLCGVLEGSDILAQPVATGSGGSVGLPMQVSQILGGLAGKSG
jgi:hypothetical protein